MRHSHLHQLHVVLKIQLHLSAHNQLQSTMGICHLEASDSLTICPKKNNGTIDEQNMFLKNNKMNMSGKKR